MGEDFVAYTKNVNDINDIYAPIIHEPTELMSTVKSPYPFRK